MLVFVKEGKPENPEKNPRSKLNLNMAPCTNRTQATLDWLLRDILGSTETRSDLKREDNLGNRAYMGLYSPSLHPLLVTRSWISSNVVNTSEFNQVIRVKAPILKVQ